MNLDKTKETITSRLNEIKVGDIIFSEGQGPCSGGARYGIGDIVVKVTKDKIFTKGHSFSVKDGWATTPPTAYYIAFWQKG